MIYLNEFDQHAAQWLRELSKERLIPEGLVDERSIKEVESKDIEGYSQCHFFAGIGGWSEALRLAGWPDAIPVWTGSCPCQPFSQAGKRKGTDDERHLWPEFRRLIAECRPPTIFGEQVASSDGREWLAGVRADLEALGYAVGCADLCAAGVGSPHIRQRLFWVANSQMPRFSGRMPGDQGRTECEIQGRREADGWQRCGVDSCRLADADGRLERDRDLQRVRQHGQQPEDSGTCGGLGDTNRARLGEQCWAVSVSSELTTTELRSDAGDGLGDSESGRQPVGCDASQPRSGRHSLGSSWSRFDLIPCRDGKTRRVESGSFPLVDGVPGRVGLLRGYGNAIVPQVAAVFVRAFMESVGIKESSGELGHGDDQRESA